MAPKIQVVHIIQDEHNRWQKFSSLQASESFERIRAVGFVSCFKQLRASLRTRASKTAVHLRVKDVQKLPRNQYKTWKKRSYLIVNLTLVSVAKLNSCVGVYVLGLWGSGPFRLFRAHEYADSKLLTTIFLRFFKSFMLKNAPIQTLNFSIETLPSRCCAVAEGVTRSKNVK